MKDRDPERFECNRVPPSETSQLRARLLRWQILGEKMRIFFMLRRRSDKLTMVLVAIVSAFLFTDLTFEEARQKLIPFLQVLVSLF